MSADTFLTEYKYEIEYVCGKVASDKIETVCLTILLFSPKSVPARLENEISSVLVPRPMFKISGLIILYTELKITPMLVSFPSSG